MDVYLVEFTFKCGFDSFCAHHLQASLFTTALRTQEPVDDSCVFAQKSQQQVLRLYVRVNVLRVVKDVPSKYGNCFPVHAPTGSAGHVGLHYDRAADR